MKPLGKKSYGSIPHLIGSRVGPSDHHAHLGQCKIATEKKRDKNDFIIVQEKLDGGNVGITKIKGNILAITRSGYLATTSPYKTHLIFNEFVNRNKKRFSELLNDGDRICGEWLFTAVGTKYNLPHEPFIPFDIFRGDKRVNYDSFLRNCKNFDFSIPTCLSIGEPLCIESALTMLNVSGHGAIDETEGAIWRVERNNEIDFLCKFVKPSKVDGKYLSNDLLNIMPSEFNYLIDYYYSL